VIAINFDKDLLDVGLRSMTNELLYGHIVSDIDSVVKNRKSVIVHRVD